MADFERLEYHLQGVGLSSEWGSEEEFKARRRNALGACNKLLHKATSDGIREYIWDIKRRIKEVEYVGRQMNFSS